MSSLYFGNKKYDLFVSIGEACSCSTTLRNANLQFWSYPLDWVARMDVVDRVKLFGNNFANYINKEDLEFYYEERSVKCNAYKNKLTGMIFNHDFKKDVPFDEMYNAVKEKYDRRVNRLLEQIKNSKRVLFVYINSPENREQLSTEKLKEVYSELKQFFPNLHIDILYLFCERDVKPFSKKITKNILKVTFDYDARNEEFPYVVNFKILDRYFRHYRISWKHITKDNRKKLFKDQLLSLYKLRFLRHI